MIRAKLLAWLKVFLDYAQGSGQRAVALIMTLIDFLGVGLMVLAEILLGGQTMVAAPANLGEYAIWSIAFWTVMNVGAVVAFHLLHPEARRQMALRAEMDQVFDEALKKLGTKRAQVSGQLSDQLSDAMLMQLVAELAAKREAVIPASAPTLAVTPANLEPSKNHQGMEDFLANH